MEKKPVTIKEIARRLNISVSAVSKALHDDPSIGLRTRMRVKAMAEELKYEPNQTAIFLQKGRTNTIGVIVPSLVESFFPQVISGIEEVANKHNYVVLLGQSMEDPEREQMLLETMKKHRVDGILISISKNTFQYDHLRKVKESIPLVFFDRIPDMKEIHYVACNLVSGTVQAMNYLLQQKHRVIGMVNGPEKLFSSRERLEGFRQALSKSRLKYDPSLVVNSDLSKESVIQAVKELLANKRKPTALIAFHDNAAIEIIEYLKSIRKDKSIPVVSFANLPMSSHTMFKPAASVEQYPYLQGQKAMEVLIDVLNNKETDQGANTAFYKIILDSRLVLLK
ncbi:LacI family transcriptional regulator [Flavihumibacter sp. RY-1]|uniref:LacI family transcriptional regulator n=1 Tax=Flavihumibacter fluminis TaxID=2909236 RepID=A0ABS9BJ64_9BACT|nr:LacI family DNA-binding transcriptional regulator [Flavihumibacter fluminis]MCF1715640.1 LacI family transcriptional regulator [Flavihumibacter fluminis]